MPRHGNEGSFASNHPLHGTGESQRSAGRKVKVLHDNDVFRHKLKVGCILEFGSYEDGAGKTTTHLFSRRPMNMRVIPERPGRVIRR